MGYRKIKVVLCFDKFYSWLIKTMGCHLCCESKGEKQIDNILMNKNLSFLKQKPFSDCV